MTSPSKLISSVAAATLLPAGLVRRDRSLCFLLDHGWFTALVEFPPEKGRPGAGVEVGASLHWAGADRLAFDVSARTDDFASLDAVRFADRVQPVVDLALVRCQSLCADLLALTTARGLLVTHEFLSDALWGNYHRGVVCALADDPVAARSYFGALIDAPDDAPWARALRKKARTLSALASTRAPFEAAVRDLVTQARAAKGLPPAAWSFPA